MNTDLRVEHAAPIAIIDFESVLRLRHRVKIAAIWIDLVMSWFHKFFDALCLWNFAS